MILGMSTATYTFLHVLISLVGIVSGLIVMYGPITGKRMDGLTAVFFDHHSANQRVRVRFSIVHVY
jgi:hypothetical protein